MKSTDALNVVASVQKLINEKLNNQICEKELINKKLSPFLLHQVFAIKTSQNFTQMIQDVQKKPSKTLHNKEMEVEPKKLHNDNMSPNKAQIEHQSSVYLKSQTKKQRRFTFSSKKPSSLGINTPRDLNKTDQQNTHFQSKTLNSNRTISAVSSIPKLSRKLSKHKNLPIKLNLKQQLIKESQDQIEQTLRQKKILQEEQKIKDYQFKALNSKRYEKLQQKFKIYKKNVETISFDFDGRIINLQEDQEDHHFEKKPTKVHNIQSRQSSHLRTFQTNKADSIINPLENEDPFNQKNDNNSINIGLPYETIYKINKKDFDSYSKCKKNMIDKNASKNVLFKSENHSYLNPSSDQQSLADGHISLNSQIKKKSPKNSELIDQELSLESSLNFQKKNSLSIVKIFRGSSSGQKSARKQQEAKFFHEKGQKYFTNNFKRQISTIPYLQITEGIRYQEKITIKDYEQDIQSSKLRFLTIEKPRNRSQNCISLDQSNTVKSNLTFRSYLVASQQGYKKSKENMLNKTISVLSQSQKSFEFFVHEHHKQFQDLKQVNKTNKEEDEFPCFDNPNPIFIRDISHIKSNKCKTSTTETEIRVHRNRVQSSKLFCQQKSTKDTQILKMKEKMLLKQKNRVISSHTTRIMK